MEFFVVISMDFGNLPLGVFMDFERAKEVVDQLGEKGNHGCIFQYYGDLTYFIGTDQRQPRNIYDNGISR